MRHRAILLVPLYVGLIVGGWLVGDGLVGVVEVDVRPSNEARVHAMIMTTTAVYMLASAVPFVPGAEIGLALMLTLGPPIALLVYLSMVVALTTAYLVGRFVPLAFIAAVFAFFGLERARRLVAEMVPLDGEARLALLTERAPPRFIPLLLGHRYVTLAVLLNVPGNTLIGGGGGIALVAGMSGVYSFARYLATVGIAVAPVPLLVMTTGYMPGLY